MDQICPKKMFPVKKEKANITIETIEIRTFDISLGTKIRFEQTIFIVQPNLLKEGISSVAVITDFSKIVTLPW